MQTATTEVAAVLAAVLAVAVGTIEEVRMTTMEAVLPVVAEDQEVPILLEDLHRQEIAIREDLHHQEIATREDRLQEIVRGVHRRHETGIRALHREERHPVEVKIPRL